MFRHQAGLIALDRANTVPLQRQMGQCGDFLYRLLDVILTKRSLSGGVSLLHRDVSREMWHKLWPQLPRYEVPIEGITNGVHTGTWLARRMRLLFERYLGPEWLQQVDDPELWTQIENIPDNDLSRIDH